MAKDKWWSKKKLPQSTPIMCSQTSISRGSVASKKTLGKNLYALASLPSLKSLVTKELAQKLMISYGYMLYQIRKMNWETDRDEIMRKVKAPLEHRFRNHCYCSDTWCRFLKAEKDGKTYTPPAGLFYCKVADKPLYDELKPIFDPFTSTKNIVENLQASLKQLSAAADLVIMEQWLFPEKTPKLAVFDKSSALYGPTCSLPSYGVKPIAPSRAPRTPDT